MNVKILTTPLDEDIIRSLKAGDVVMINGLIFTGRESFYLRAAEEGIIPPVDFQRINLQMHVGPVVEESDLGYRVLGLTPTTSIRMERYAGDMIEKLGTRALIGKGTMGAKTAAAMKKTGCVHLSNIGIIPCLLASSVKRVVEVHFLEDIGPTEATWIFEVEDFGPFLVDMDANGNNYFDLVRAETEAQRFKALRTLGVPEDFQYTPI